jgi:hypothetical protein
LQSSFSLVRWFLRTRMAATIIVVITIMLIANFE